MANLKSYKVTHTQLVNELSKKVPIGLVIKFFDIATKHDQPGHSSLICLGIIKDEK